MFICVAVIVHADTLRRVNFTTHDDMALDLIAAGGLSKSLQWITGIAREQGRVGYYVSGWTFVVPFLTESDIVRSVMASSVQFLSLLTLGVFVALYLGVATAALFLLLIYGLMPHWWQHFPIVAYPVIYHTPVLLFFSGMSSYVAICRQMDCFKRYRSGILVFGLLLIFLALFFYEAATFIFIGTCVFVMYAEVISTPGIGFRSRMARVMRAHWPLVATVASYFAVYLVYRVLHPPVYPGTSVDSAALTNPKGLLRVIGLFGIGGLPGINFFWQSVYISQFAVGSVASDGLVRFIANNLTAYEFFVGCGFSCIVLVMGWNINQLLEYDQFRLRLLGRRWLKKGEVKGHKKFLWTAVVAVAVAFLVQLPLGLSPKYQKDTRLWAPYITGYYSYIAFSIALACTAIFVFSNGRKLNGIWFKGIIALSGCSSMVLFCLNAVASEAVIRSQEDHYAKWRLVRMLARSDIFKEVPRHAIIVAPSLWRGISPAFSQSEGYWNEYFANHFMKPVRVVPSLEAVAPSRYDGLPLYYCAVDQGVEPKYTTLMFSAVRNDGYGLLTDRIYLVGWHDFKRDYLSFLVRDLLSDRKVRNFGGHIEDVQRITAIPVGKPIPGGFISQVDAVGSKPASAVLITRAPTPSPMVELAFEKGFSGYETGGGNYWRWSDGPSGEGLLRLLNHGKGPLKVRFTTQILTGSKEPVRFAINVGQETEIFSVHDGQTLSREFVVVPGRTEIKLRSFGGRMQVADPRYIVFGLQNWIVTDAS